MNNQNNPNPSPILIAGAGIGGLAAALACSRAQPNRTIQVWERAPELTEVGAGIQLGPNATRILQSWGLESALRDVAAFPEKLSIHSAQDDAVLGQLRLGERAQQKYGAPYATIHRADIQQLLFQAVQERPHVEVHLGHGIASFQDDGTTVSLRMEDGSQAQGAALIGADGIWSVIRTQLLQDGKPRFPGYLAYRNLVAQSALPASLRSQNVTVWIGSNLHVVQYPVRGGEYLNIVAIVHGNVPAGWNNLANWDNANNSIHAAHLQEAYRACSPRLREQITAFSSVGRWRLWALCDRPPMRGAYEHARGNVALLGDAAHPMRPYMAQGAGMALEDAACLEKILSQNNRTMPLSVQELLHDFATQRWQRNARVQARSIRNGKIFHAQGFMRWGRDWGMKLLGEKVLDVPWLYRASNG
jgi:salicylate hydroxylase